MRAMPLDIGIIHFVGIGGIGMSGIAEILHNLGYQVRGSDLAANANVARLRDLGVDVVIGQKPENVADAQVVVVSSAIKRDNPELAAARQQQIPVVRRAEMLAELMRLKWCVAVGGTHGKTTTTSLIAQLLDGAGLDPTVINGVEADESDGTFVKLPATIAVVTNIDPEHLDFYGDAAKLHEAFDSFVANIPFYGFAVVCIDHPQVQSLIGRVTDRRTVTYGFSPQAELRAHDLRAEEGGQVFDVTAALRAGEEPLEIKGLRLPMFGKHNVSNALAAIAVALEMGIDPEKIREALAAFGGVKRRFTKTGEAHGISVVDDYGHHPVEIAAVLQAARSATKGRVIAVVQPHRYTRLQNLFEEFCACFNDADEVIVADVYSAGEAHIEGADRDSLVDGLRQRGHRHVAPLEDPADLPGMVMERAASGDLVVCLGAGNITAWAQALPDQLSALSPKQAAGGAS